MGPDDLICVKCGYSLKMIPTDRTCPECGVPIARSIAETEAFGHGGRRRFFRRALLVNALAIYLPGSLLLLLVPLLGYAITLKLIVLCPVLLPLLHLDDSTPDLSPTLLAAMAVSLSLPYLAARLYVWATVRYQGVSWAIPTALIFFSSVETMLSIVFIASAG